jgi:hypothetical protein
LEKFEKGDVQHPLQFWTSPFGILWNIMEFYGLKKTFFDFFRLFSTFFRLFFDFFRLFFTSVWLFPLKPPVAKDKLAIVLGWHLSINRLVADSWVTHQELTWENNK